MQALPPSLSPSQVVPFWCWNETCKLNGDRRRKPGNSKLISQRLHVVGKSGGKFGKDGLTKEVVCGSCVCVTIIAI